MQDRRQVKSFMTDIFKHCVKDYRKRHKNKHPLNERRKAMTREQCPKCNIPMYGRADNFKCYKCNCDYRKNHNGEMVQTNKPEEENNSFVIYHGA